MKKSIFRKILFVILPIIIIAEIGTLSLAYFLIYDSNFNYCENNVRIASKMAAENFALFDPNNIEDSKKCDSIFTSICESFNLAYVYAIKPDTSNGSIEYLSIGFGNDATEEARNTRYAGVVVKDSLNSSEVEALNGTDDGVIKIESTRFGETITCYFPVTSYYDSESGEYIDETVSFVGAEFSFAAVKKRFNKSFGYIAGFTGISTLIIIGMFLIVFYNAVSKPAKKISSKMSNYASNIGKENVKLEVKGKDEFAEMSESFNKMTDEIDNYIGDITKLNKEKNTREAELDIANNIQNGLLAPSHCRSGKISISAIMNPAKEVGGDLYNYRVDKDRVYIAVADVSGKGISAALFMSRAITMLQQYASQGYYPAETLKGFNKNLASHNPNGLFITAFVALYDCKTETLHYSNAGHNLPYILGKEVKTLDGARGMAAGIFDDADYDEATVSLKPGESLVLYTDGVNEAESVSGEFFGNERLEEVLGKSLGKTDEFITGNVINQLNRFTVDSQQNDDITILTLSVLSEDYHTEMKLEAVNTEYEKISRSIDENKLIPDKCKNHLLIAAEEMFVNICSYAYGEKGGEVTVIIDVSDKTEITFIDYGTEFDPTKDVINIDEYDMENTVGGLGRFITFSIMDEYSYRRENGANILTISKNNY